MLLECLWLKTKTKPKHLTSASDWCTLRGRCTVSADIVLLMVLVYKHAGRGDESGGRLP